MTYKKKTLNEIKTNITLNIVNNVDEINDANIGSALDMFVTSVSEELEEQYEDLDVIYKGTRISTATGGDLEEIGAVVGVQRNMGSKTEGSVSFIRNAPATTTFNIPSGSIISVQPNSQDKDYKYVTKQTVIFPTTINNESQLFLDGIYLYKLNQRFIDNITSLTGTVSGSPHTFTLNTDYIIIHNYEGMIIDVNSLVLVEGCEDAGGWEESYQADPTTANTDEYVQGTQSLNLLKSLTTSNILSYSNILSSTIDISDLNLYVNLFVQDETTLNKIHHINIYIGSNSGVVNSFMTVINSSSLTEGWQKLILNRFNASTQIMGNPDTLNMNFLRIEVILNNITDTLEAGNLLMDFWNLARHEDYFGDVISFNKDSTVPDNSTNILTTYVPLSVEVPVEAESIGVGYNASKGRIIYKVSNISNIDKIYNYVNLTGGLNVELDNSYRLRVQNATNLKTNATVNAIRFNVLNLDFAGSVSVIDTPMRSVVGEPHTYYTGTDLYKLVREVAQDDVDLDITGTSAGSPITFIKGTDYILTEFNEIDWSVGGDNPDDGTIFYVDYNYRWLGHFDVYVVGQAGQLTSSQLNQVEVVVEDTKSAGTIANVVEPTYVSINVELNLIYADGYSGVTVDDRVREAISNYINNLDIGRDVLLAAIIKTAMSVTGVFNVNVVDIGGGGPVDYLLNLDEKAQSNVITIG